MGTRGFIVYRFRGRYYITYNHWDSYPEGLGQNILAEIPTDPEEFEEWKRAKIAEHRAEETRILNLARQDPPRDHGDEDFWGYSTMPCRSRPRPDLFIEWIYIIDLDQNVFAVSARDYPESAQAFRLDNIPRSLFVGDEVMTVAEDNVPVACWADYLLENVAPETELLALYHSFSPQPMLSIQPATHVTPWMRLQLQLLQQFVEYFLKSFKDVSDAEKSSYFISRQLSYVVLCLTRPGGCSGMKFQPTNTPHKLRFGTIRNNIRTPSWEPPDANIFRLGNVLIVLNNDIYDSEGRLAPISDASIANAVQLAIDEGNESDNVVLIFAIHSIVIVQIHQTAEGPQISHTANLPLLNVRKIATAYRANQLEASTQDTGGAEALAGPFFFSAWPVESPVQSPAVSRPWNLDDTPGIEALMSLFSSRSPPLQPPAVSHPWNLPIELCQHIFRCADPGSQSALEGTCRLFRGMAAEYPRIGEWTLLKCTGDAEFIAFRSSTLSEHVVKLKALGIRPLDPKDTAFEVGFWGDDEKVQVNMPLLMVREVVAQEKMEAE